MTTTSANDQSTTATKTASEVFVFPTSYAQRSLWILSQLAPESPYYNLISGVRITKALDIQLLEQSLNEVVRRHEALRTVFKVIDGEPMQVVTADLKIKATCIDLRQLTACEREQEVCRLASHEAQRPFDLGEWPLLRTSILRLDAEEYVHLLTIHHIVCDYWSMSLLFAELSTLYEAYREGRPSPLPELKIQYGDYAEWESRWIQGLPGQTHLAYWKEQLAGLSELQMPTDSPRPPVASFMGASHHFNLPASLHKKLVDLSQKENVTLFMTLLAAFQTVLHRYSGQADIAIGTPVANRNRVEVEDLIGFFVNSVILRSDLSGDPSFRDLLQKVRNTALDAFAHQEFPFEKLVQELKPERSASRNPLFQVHFQLFNYMDDLDGNAVAGALDGQSLETDTETAKFDLALDLWEHREGIGGYFEYSTDLFRHETVARMANHLLTLLDGVCSNPNQRLSELPLLTTDEIEQLHRWNQTERAYPREKCLHQLFESQAYLTPDAVAVVFRDHEITYASLNRRANQLANYLRKLGVGPETVVAICVERSIEMIVGLLGILKAGAAYLPVDPAEPTERQNHILVDSRARVLLSECGVHESVVTEGLEHVLLDQDWQKIARNSDKNPAITLASDNLAYVIYTSGSTGIPKAVMIESRAICNHMLWMQTTFPLTAADRALLKYPYNFDASIYEIFGPLLAGARLIIYEPTEHWDVEDFVSAITTNQVTVLDLVPSMLEALLDDEDFCACGSLRRIICGGETLTPKLRDRFFSLVNAELHNIYGPTEATIGASFWTCSEADDHAVVPIGKPGANMQIYLLDPHSQLVPIGVPGEIYIGGDGLARGYLNQPLLTAEKFATSSNRELFNVRLFRTGDLARLLPNGELAFLGRLDDQLKVRGYLVEPAEVEGTITKHAGVRQAVVLPTATNSNGYKKLTAYVVPKQEDPELWPSLGEYDVYDELLYFAMTHDEIRNEAYKRAIVRYVRDKVVVDIGTGADALLARFCVEAGAKRVYAVEVDEAAFRSAQNSVKELNLSEQITVLFGDSTQMHLPELVDVCVSEILGTIGSSEGAVPVLEDARRLLREGGKIIPQKCTTLIAPASLPPNLAQNPKFGPLPQIYAQKAFEKAGRQFDIRLCIRGFPPANLLSPPRTFEDLDFNGHIDPRGYEFETEFKINRDAALDGFLLWLNVWTGEDGFLDSLNNQLSWLPVFFPVFYPSQNVLRGDTIILSCSCRYAERDRMPYYTIEGRVHRRNGELIPFSHTSARYALPSDQNAFHRALLNASFDETNPGEVTARYSHKHSGRPPGGLIPELRKFVRDRLPHYMLPSSFVVLDELPVTISGKIDRAALPMLGHEMTIPQEGYIAPRNEAEQLLATIWCDLLHLDRVGVYDNFFELGGDSILSIQIIARANDAGLRLRPAQLFQYQTIAAIAGVAELSLPANATRTNTFESSGLGPMQRWIMELNCALSDWDHQFRLVEIPRPLDLVMLGLAVSNIIVHHEQLRSCFVQTEAGWQRELSTDSEISIASIKLDVGPEASLVSTVENSIEGPQLSIEKGPLVAAAMLDLGETRGSYLLLIIHSLVVDDASWDIILEDLWNGYEQLVAGSEIRLPSATAPYHLWSERVARLMNSADLNGETSHWLEMARTIRYPQNQFHDIGLDHPVETMHATLPAQDTRLLTDQIPTSLPVRVEDVLLTALAKVLIRWTGQETILVAVEGSARAYEIDNLQLSRTVGCFATLFPVALGLSHAVEPGEALRSIKEQLRQVPKQGLGFSLLRGGLRSDKDVKEAMHALSMPVAAFSYSRGRDGSPYKTVARNRAGHWMLARHLMSYPGLIDVHVQLVDSQLETAWAYSPMCHTHSAIENLMLQFYDEVRSLISACGSSSISSFTPSDFALAGLSQKDLDKLLASLNGRPGEEQARQ